MFEKLKYYITPGTQVKVQEDNSDTILKFTKVQVASSALMVDLAKADGSFTVDERNTIANCLHKVFNIEILKADELIKLSEEELKESISLYEFSEVINEYFTREEKIELIDTLWKIIYADNKLDKYEDKLVKQIGGLFRLGHKDVINSKLVIKNHIEKHGH